MYQDKVSHNEQPTTQSELAEQKNGNQFTTAINMTVNIPPTLAGSKGDARNKLAEVVCVSHSPVPTTMSKLTYNPPQSRPDRNRKQAFSCQNRDIFYFIMRICMMYSAELQTIL